MTYEYGPDARGEWRWHLKGADDRIIAISSEGYRDESDCEDAIVLVKSSQAAPMKKLESF